MLGRMGEPTAEKKCTTRPLARLYCSGETQRGPFMGDGQLRPLINRLMHTVGRDGGQLSDAQLVERFVLTRDEAAFESLLWRHGPMVLALCRRLLRHRHDAEDAFQATF